MYDLVIKQAKLIDNTMVDIAVKAGKIAKIAQEINAEAVSIVEVPEESYVSAGWIDGHVHCFPSLEIYYDFADEVGVANGVTTVIDAGSTGANNIGEFYDLTRAAKTNVFALINVSRTGIIKQDELSDMSLVDGEAVAEAIQAYPDFIVGLKARMSRTVVGNNGVVPLDVAKEMQCANHHLPLMVHIGSTPPDLRDILMRLEPGDIVTHCFNGKENGILNSDDTIKEFVWDAYHEGIIFDIGHGTDSFNFHVAEMAFKEKLKATTISTDIYHTNRESGPVFNLATTMEKLLEVGYTMEELIEKVTAKPAEYFNLTSKGKIDVGYDADFTIFNLVESPKELIDSNGNKKTGHTQIVPTTAIIGGEVHGIN